MRKLPKFDCKNIHEDTEWLGYLQLLSAEAPTGSQGNAQALVQACEGSRVGTVGQPV